MYIVVSQLSELYMDSALKEMLFRHVALKNWKTY